VRNSLPSDIDGGGIVSSPRFDRPPPPATDSSLDPRLPISDLQRVGMSTARQKFPEAGEALSSKPNPIHSYIPRILYPRVSVLQSDTWVLGVG
jgi:hypothetical protein